MLKLRLWNREADELGGQNKEKKKEMMEHTIHDTSISMCMHTNWIF